MIQFENLFVKSVKEIRLLNKLLFSDLFPIVGTSRISKKDIYSAYSESSPILLKFLWNGTPALFLLNG